MSRKKSPRVIIEGEEARRTRGLVDSMMPMGYELVQLVAECVFVVCGVRPIRHTIHQSPTTGQQDKSHEQQENGAEIIKSQRRGQNSRQNNHIVNLLYEAPELLLPIIMIDHVQGLSQGNLSAKCPEKCGLDVNRTDRTARDERLLPIWSMREI